MNKFITMYGEKKNLDLRDIVNWTENGRRNGQLMVHETPENKIGLLNLNTAVPYPKEFEDTNELEQHLKTIRADGQKISVLESGDWTVYVP